METKTQEKKVAKKKAPVKKKQVQPKTHVGKTKEAVKLRRKKIIKALIEGKTQKEAGIEAGLSPKTAQSQVSTILIEPDTQKTFRQLLNKVIPDEALTAKYASLMESKKVISAMVMAGDGMKDFIEVDDCPTQLRAADSVSRLKGYLTDKDVEVKVPITVVVRRFSDDGNKNGA